MRPNTPQTDPFAFRDPPPTEALSRRYRTITVIMLVLGAMAFIAGAITALPAVFRWLVNPSDFPDSTEAGAIWLQTAGMIAGLVGIMRRTSTLDTRATRTPRR